MKKQRTKNNSVFLPVANIYVDSNVCDNVILSLESSFCNGALFEIIGSTLYLISKPKTGFYSVLVVAEDKFGRYEALKMPYSIFVTECTEEECPPPATTTTTPPTTPPPPPPPTTAPPTTTPTTAPPTTAPPTTPPPTTAPPTTAPPTTAPPTTAPPTTQQARRRITESIHSQVNYNIQAGSIVAISDSGNWLIVSNATYEPQGTVHGFARFVAPHALDLYQLTEQGWTHRKKLEERKTQAPVTGFAKLPRYYAAAVNNNGVVAVIVGTSTVREYIDNIFGNDYIETEITNDAEKFRVQVWHYNGSFGNTFEKMPQDFILARLENVENLDNGPALFDDMKPMSSKICIQNQFEVIDEVPTFRIAVLDACERSSGPNRSYLRTYLVKNMPVGLVGEEVTTLGLQQNTKSNGENDYIVMSSDARTLVHACTYNDYWDLGPGTLQPTLSASEKLDPPTSIEVFDLDQRTAIVKRELLVSVSRVSDANFGQILMSPIHPVVNIETSNEFVDGEIYDPAINNTPDDARLGPRFKVMKCESPIAISPDGEYIAARIESMNTWNQNNKPHKFTAMMYWNRSQEAKEANLGWSNGSAIRAASQTKTNDVWPEGTRGILGGHWYAYTRYLRTCDTPDDHSAYQTNGIAISYDINDITLRVDKSNIRIHDFSNWRWDKNYAYPPSSNRGRIHPLGTVLNIPLSEQANDSIPDGGEYIYWLDNLGELSEKYLPNARDGMTPAEWLNIAVEGMINSGSPGQYPYPEQPPAISFPNDEHPGGRYLGAVEYHPSLYIAYLDEDMPDGGELINSPVSVSRDGIVAVGFPQARYNQGVSRGSGFARVIDINDRYNELRVTAWGQGSYAPEGFVSQAEIFYVGPNDENYCGPTPTCPEGSIWEDVTLTMYAMSASSSLKGLTSGAEIGGDGTKGTIFVGNGSLAGTDAGGTELDSLRPAFLIAKDEAHSMSNYSFWNKIQFTVGEVVIINMLTGGDKLNGNYTVKAITDISHEWTGTLSDYHVVSLECSASTSD